MTMSKHNELSTIDHAALTTVHGGLEVTGKGKVEIGPGSGSIEGDVTYKRTPYESCLATVTSRKKADGTPDWDAKDIPLTCGLPS
jgi:hypothetical protein